MTAISYVDNCRFTPTAGGTTDWTYSANVAGYQSPSAAAIVNGATYRYFAISADLSQWEIGYGTYNTSTGVLTRTTVLYNSLGTTAKVNFTVAPTVAIVVLAEDLANFAILNGPNTFTVASASAIVVGPNGATNPTWQIDTSVASAATGLQLQGEAAGSGVALSVLSSGTNESLTVNAKGSGVIKLGSGYSTSAAGPTVQVGNGTWSGDDSLLALDRSYTPSSGLLNSHAARDESALTVAVTGSQFSGYASFDSIFTISGSATTPQNHMHGFQARATWAATGTCNEWAGFTSQAAINNASGTIANAYGFFVLDANKTAGAINYQYGFYANTLSQGGTGNYFLYQGGTGNLSVLPGGLCTGGATAHVSAEVNTVQFNSASQYGDMYNDVGTAATAAALVFRKGGSQVGVITLTSTNTTYTTTSDETQKDFIGPYDPDKAAAIIRADPVRDFYWKSDGSYAVGWGAQTSYNVSADLATPPAAKGMLWGVDQSKRTPYLWAAVSRLLDRVDALEARTLKETRLD